MFTFCWLLDGLLQFWQRLSSPPVLRYVSSCPFKFSDEMARLVRVIEDFFAHEPAYDDARMKV